ncbi:hypothetical protein SprV_0602209600 [Sparganum proliferum]
MGNFAVGFEDTRECAAETGKVFPSFRLGVVDNDARIVEFSIGRRIEHDHRFIHVDNQSKVCTVDGEKAHALFHARFVHDAECSLVQNEQLVDITHGRTVCDLHASGIEKLAIGPVDNDGPRTLITVGVQQQGGERETEEAGSRHAVPPHPNGCCEYLLTVPLSVTRAIMPPLSSRTTEFLHGFPESIATHGIEGIRGVHKHCAEIGVHFLLQLSGDDDHFGGFAVSLEVKLAFRKKSVFQMTIERDASEDHLETVELQDSSAIITDLSVSFPPVGVDDCHVPEILGNASLASHSLKYRGKFANHSAVAILVNFVRDHI